MNQNLTNTVFRIQPMKPIVYFVSDCLCTLSTVYICGTNYPISMGFSPNVTGSRGMSQMLEILTLSYRAIKVANSFLFYCFERSKNFFCGHLSGLCLYSTLKILQYYIYKNLAINTHTHIFYN